MIVYLVVINLESIRAAGVCVCVSACETLGGGPDRRISSPTLTPLLFWKIQVKSEISHNLRFPGETGENILTPTSRDEAVPEHNTEYNWRVRTRTICDRSSEGVCEEGDSGGWVVVEGVHPAQCLSGSVVY